MSVNIPNIKYQSEEHHLMMDAMEKYGGSFVQNLGRCFRTADMINFRKLLSTFPGYSHEYLKIGKRKERNEQK